MKAELRLGVTKLLLGRQGRLSATRPKLSCRGSGVEGGGTVEAQDKSRVLWASARPRGWLPGAWDGVGWVGVGRGEDEVLFDVFGETMRERSVGGT